MLKDIDNSDNLELSMLFDDNDEHIIKRPGNKSLNVNNDKVDVNPVTADGILDHSFPETNTGSSINVEKDGVSLKPGDQFNDLPLKTSNLITAQHGDPSLSNLWEKVVSEEEIESQSQFYFMKHDKWLSNKEDGDVCKYVIEMKNKLASACKTAKSHLLESQDDMKRQYDRKSAPREFDVGDQVLLLLPLPGSPLKATYQGPFQVVQKVGGLNYVVATPGRRKKNCVM